VFNEEREAVKDLRGIKSPPPVVTDAIATLVEADRQLAQRAIDDAAGGDPVELQKANDRMAKAAQDVADGKYPEAINHYKEAWKHARRA
jgi:flagellar motor switch protein FliM